MPKASKKKKTQKAQDFKKVKLKVGKKRPTNDNFTDTSFKTKAVTLSTQSVSVDKDSLLTTSNNRSLPDLLSKAKHYSPSVRKDALIGLIEILTTHNSLIKTDLEALINASCKRIIDDDINVRKANLDFTKLLYQLCELSEIATFVDLHAVFVLTGLSHIQEDIRQDSLKFLDILVDYVPSQIKPYGNNSRHGLLFSLSKFLQVLFGNFSKNGSGISPKLNSLHADVDFPPYSTNFCVLPNLYSQNLIENTDFKNLNLFGEQSHLKSSEQKSLIGENTSLYNNDPNFKMAMDLLLNIFSFLEATWIETAPALFNLSHDASNLKKRFKGKAKVNVLEIRIISVVLKIVSSIWESTSDASFMSETFEFVTYYNETKVQNKAILPGCTRSSIFKFRKH
ncbi:Testis-expressed sequence 10 protein-like protein [Smittium culicis]|uniref:Pre-rRNA-processing protein n=1 Tax=Smittium culicis TaxID=133412 RepID=A0A1R1WZI3_9FUNG|nr:Testis-expressed sequence 10 protein-like protein [Smittium culicis]